MQVQIAGARGTLPLIIAAAVFQGCVSTPVVRGTPGSPVSDARVIAEQTIIPTKTIRPAEAAEIEIGAAPDSGEASVPDYMAVYRIAAGDLLNFRSFDDQSLNTEVIVRHDGYISLPWVEDLKISDLTRTEATTKVEDAYNQLFFDAQVSLQIMEARSRAFIVMGDVTRPAEYPFTRPVTLLDGINAAGGLRINQRAGDSFVGAQGQLVKAYIIRHVDGERRVIEYDLRGLQEDGPHASDAPIYPGDTVYVPAGLNLVYLLGELEDPNVFALFQGMTLLQLLANASSFRESTARLRDVVLIRETNASETKVMLINVKEILRTGADPLLEPGDIVYVPRKRLIDFQEFIGRLVGPISQVIGLYTQAYNAYHIRENRLESILTPGPSGTVDQLVKALESANQAALLPGNLSSSLRAFR